MKSVASTYKPDETPKLTNYLNETPQIDFHGTNKPLGSIHYGGFEYIYWHKDYWVDVADKVFHKKPKAKANALMSVGAWIYLMFNIIDELKEAGIHL